MNIRVLGKIETVGFCKSAPASPRGTWNEALLVPVNVNATNGFANYNDWKLPNMKELETIVAYNCKDPSFNLSIFPSTHPSTFWTSSNRSDDEVFSWVVFFNSGGANTFSRSRSESIRLVRTDN